MSSTPKFPLILLLVAAILASGCASKPAKPVKSAAVTSPVPASNSADTATPGKSPMSARVGIGSTNALIYLPMSVATARNYFKAENLTIEKPSFKGGAVIAQALMTGELDFALFSYNHIIKYQTQGIDLVAVAMIAELPGSALVVDSRYKEQITKLEDLQSVKVGITSPGSGSHDALLSMAKAANMVPEGIQAEGVGFNLAQAFAEDKVKVGVTYEPWVSILLESGKGVLLNDPRTDLRSAAGVNALYASKRFPMTTLVTHRSVVEKNPELVQRMVNAIVSANYYIATHSAEEVSAIVPDTDKGDPTYYVAALKNAKSIIAAKGTMDTETVEAVIEDLKNMKTVARSAIINPASMFEDKFVKVATFHK